MTRPKKPSRLTIEIEGVKVVIEARNQRVARDVARRLHRVSEPAHPIFPGEQLSLFVEPSD